jgi:hypothetical protein
MPASQHGARGKQSRYAFGEIPRDSAIPTRSRFASPDPDGTLQTQSAALVQDLLEACNNRQYSNIVAAFCGWLDFIGVPIYPLTVTKLALHLAMRTEAAYAKPLWTATHSPAGRPHAPLRRSTLVNHGGALRKVSRCVAQLWPAAQCVVDTPKSYIPIYEIYS